MLDFIDADIRGEKIHPLLKFAVDQLAGDMENPRPLTYNVMYCRLTGIWVRRDYANLDFLLNSLIVLPQLFNFVFMVTNLGLNINNFMAIVENLSYSSVCIVGLYMTFLFLGNVKRYDSIISNVVELNDKFPIGVKSFSMEKKSRFVTNFFTNYCLGGVSLYLITPYFTKSQCSHSGAVVCGLPTAGSFPYNATAYPAYELTYIFHGFCAVSTVMTILQAYLFVGGVFMQLISHLKALAERLHEINDKEPEEQLRFLRKFIVHHAAVLDVGVDASDAFRSIMFVVSCGFSIVISILFFQLMLMTVSNTNDKFDFNAGRYFMHVLGWALILLIVSIMGQLIHDTSESIANDIYGVLWYDQPCEFQKLVHIILMRSQIPLTLKTSGGAPIALITFMNVLSSTYSYLTLMYKFVSDSY